MIQGILYQLGAINNVYCDFVLLDEQGIETSDCSALVVLKSNFFFFLHIQRSFIVHSLSIQFKYTAWA